ncbi:hypothetical protein AB0K51_10940 [Kitasatospora sp. NPDC049285]|uniref:hypothetical protein n=1 Tax=Kitasatospora sp. NPDC049285 TaxID=3157096 RepID=UPI003421A3CB
MALTVTVRLPGSAHPDHHLAAWLGEDRRILHCADVLYGEGDEHLLRDLLRRCPGCAVVALHGPDGVLRIGTRHRPAIRRYRLLTGHARTAAALAGALAHARLTTGT